MAKTKKENKTRDDKTKETKSPRKSKKGDTSNTSTKISNILKKTFVVIANVIIYCLDVCIILIPYMFQPFIIFVLVYVLCILCPFFILCLLFRSAREGIASAISAIASKISTHFQKLVQRPYVQHLIYPLNIGDDGRIHYSRQFGNAIDEILDSNGGIFHNDDF